MSDSSNTSPASNSTSYNEKHVASLAITSLHCGIPCSMRWQRTTCTGCFSWCRLHMPWVAKKGSPQVSTDLCCEISLTHSRVQKPENPPAIVPATMSAENIMEPKPDEGRFTFCNLSDVNVDSENSQSVVPTKTDYTMATVKEVLTLSQSAAAVTPVPFLQEAIGVALKIIQVCEVRRISPLKVASQMIKNFIRRHRLLKKRSKNCKLGWAIS
jgi:hypothetical protein